MPSIIQQGVVRSSPVLRRNYRSRNDSIVRIYRSIFDGRMTNEVQVYLAQQAYVDDPLPAEGSIFDGTLAPHLVAQDFTVKPKEGDKSLKIWDTTVNWRTIEPGEPPGQQESDPLQRAPIYNIEYIETTRPIEEAENLVNLPHGNGNGGLRAAGTKGPIVNAAGARGDEPQSDTERNAVLTITKNYPQLSDITELNETYQRTTNSDEVQGFPPETLKYLVTDSLGQRIEQGVAYYPATTRIEKKKTTQRIIDNMGYAYWDANAGAIVDDKEVKDLMNLNLNGELGSTHTTIPYRYLSRVPYTSLINGQ